MSIEERIHALAEAYGRQTAHAYPLAAYVELVERWNVKIDLTAALEQEKLVEVLLADAFMLSMKQVLPAGARILDVGSGAGAPAIPVAIMRPDLSMTLVEPMRKRVAFLRTAIGVLGLRDRVRVIEARLNLDRPNVPGAPFHVAMARATFAPEVWWRVARSLADQVLVLTTVKEELPENPDLSWAYQIPSSQAPRIIAVYQRDIPT